MVFQYSIYDEVVKQLSRSFLANGYKHCSCQHHDLSLYKLLLVNAREPVSQEGAAPCKCILCTYVQYLGNRSKTQCLYTPKTPRANDSTGSRNDAGTNRPPRRLFFLLLSK